MEPTTFILYFLSAKFNFYENTLSVFENQYNYKNEIYINFMFLKK
jgi:hypothetical protein